MGYSGHRHPSGCCHYTRPRDQDEGLILAVIDNCLSGFEKMVWESSYLNTGGRYVRWEIFLELFWVQVPPPAPRKIRD
jgi:hypothetical protein